MVDKHRLINRKRTYRKQNYDDSAFNHPAKMHPEIAEWLIRRVSKKGDLIYDPFTGIGTTLVEGMILSRNVIGTEIEKNWLDSAQLSCEKQLKMKSEMYQPGTYRLIHADSRDVTITPPANAVITSPPYGIVMQGGGEALNQRRGGMREYHHFNDNNKENPGNFRFGTDKYKNLITQVYKNCYTNIELYGMMAILTKNFHYKGEYIELYKHHIDYAESVGWKFMEHHQFQLPYITYWQKINRDKYPDRVVVDWEDAIILRKVK